MRTRALLTAVVLLAGCGSIEGARKKHGPAAEKTLTAAAQVREDLRGRHEALAPIVPPGEPVVVDFFDAGRDDNAVVVYEEDLERRGELGNVYARIDGTRWLAECGAFLDHGTYEWDPRKPSKWTEAAAAFDAERSLERCGRVRFLFVIRTVAFARPSGLRAVPAGNAGADASVSDPALASLLLPPDEKQCAREDVRCVFSPGYLKLEVHFYGLDPVAHRGAFVVEAENSEKVVFFRNAPLVEENLSANAKIALARAFAQHAPFVKLKGMP